MRTLRARRNRRGRAGVVRNRRRLWETGSVASRTAHRRIGERMQQSLSDLLRCDDTHTGMHICVPLVCGSDIIRPNHTYRAAVRASESGVSRAEKGDARFAKSSGEMKRAAVYSDNSCGAARRIDEAGDGGGVHVNMPERGEFVRALRGDVGG